MLPDGRVTQFMSPRGKVLLGAFCYGGSVNGAGLCPFHGVRDVRGADRLDLFDVGASCRLAGYQVPARHPSNDPNLAVAIHPEATFGQRNLAAVNAAGGVVPLVKNQPAVSHREIVPMIVTPELCTD